MPGIPFTSGFKPAPGFSWGNFAKNFVGYAPAVGGSPTTSAAKKVGLMAARPVMGGAGGLTAHHLATSQDVGAAFGGGDTHAYHAQQGLASKLNDNNIGALDFMLAGMAAPALRHLKTIPKPFSPESVASSGKVIGAGKGLINRGVGLPTQAFGRTADTFWKANKNPHVGYGLGVGLTAAHGVPALTDMNIHDIFGKKLPPNHPYAAKQKQVDDAVARGREQGREQAVKNFNQEKHNEILAEVAKTQQKPEVTPTSTAQDQPSLTSQVSDYVSKQPNWAKMLGVGAGALGTYALADGLFGDDEDEYGRKRRKGMSSWLAPLAGLGVAGLGAHYLTDGTPSKLLERDWWTKTNSAKKLPLVMLPYKMKLSSVVPPPIPGLPQPPQVPEPIPAPRQVGPEAAPTPKPVQDTFYNPNQPHPKAFNQFFGTQKGYTGFPAVGYGVSQLGQTVGGQAGEIAQRVGDTIAGKPDTDTKTPAYAANALATKMQQYQANPAAAVGAGLLGPFAGAAAAASGNVVTQQQQAMSPEDKQYGHDLLKSHAPYGIGAYEQQTGHEPGTPAVEGTPLAEAKFPGGQRYNPATGEEMKVQVVPKSTAIGISNRVAHAVNKLHPEAADPNNIHNKLNEAHRQLQAANPDTPPEGIWDMLQQFWSKLDPTSQLLVGIGLPLAAVALFSSMFGGGDDDEGGGISSFLPMLGIAGLGAAAYGSGVFDSNSPLRKYIGGDQNAFSDPKPAIPAPPQALPNVTADLLSNKGFSPKQLEEELQRAATGDRDAMQLFASLDPSAKDMLMGMTANNPALQQRLQTQIANSPKVREQHNAETEAWRAQYAPSVPNATGQMTAVDNPVAASQDPRTKAFILPNGEPNAAAVGAAFADPTQQPVLQEAYMALGPKMRASMEQKLQRAADIPILGAKAKEGLELLQKWKATSPDTSLQGQQPAPGGAGNVNPNQPGAIPANISAEEISDLATRIAGAPNTDAALAEVNEVMQQLPMSAKLQIIRKLDETVSRPDDPNSDYNLQDYGRRITHDRATQLRNMLTDEQITNYLRGDEASFDQFAQAADPQTLGYMAQRFANSDAGILSALSEVGYTPETANRYGQLIKRTGSAYEASLAGSPLKDNAYALQAYLSSPYIPDEQKQAFMQKLDPNRVAELQELLASSDKAYETDRATLGKMPSADFLKQVRMPNMNPTKEMLTRVASRNFIDGDKMTSSFNDFNKIIDEVEGLGEIPEWNEPGPPTEEYKTTAATRTAKLDKVKQSLIALGLPTPSNDEELFRMAKSVLEATGHAADYSATEAAGRASPIDRRSYGIRKRDWFPTIAEGLPADLPIGPGAGQKNPYRNDPPLLANPTADQAHDWQTWLNTIGKDPAKFSKALASLSPEEWTRLHTWREQNQGNTKSVAPLIDAEWRRRQRAGLLK